MKLSVIMLTVKLLLIVTVVVNDTILVEQHRDLVLCNMVWL